jgi:hypothetical protein
MSKRELVKLISFMSTFDGGLYRRTNRHGNLNNAQFIMNMRKSNLDYVDWVSSILGQVTGTTIKDRKDYNTDGYSRSPQVRLESRCHPFLTRIHSRIYMDGKKVIDPHMLKLLDAEALAIIFMADGSVSDRGYVNLNTKGFSYADNAILSKTIYENLDIRTNINKHYNYFYLRVPVKDSGLFYVTVKPFVKESFNYKLERLAPHNEGDDIVWTPQECGEVSREDLPHVD